MEGISSIYRKDMIRWTSMGFWLYIIKGALM